jgi:hypothetical protein
LVVDCSWQQHGSTGSGASAYSYRLQLQRKTAVGACSPHSVFLYKQLEGGSGCHD